jgi:septal ring factor EnvC (AmiA/AmiB activator)
MSTNGGKDAFDTADRVLWATRFKGMACALARHENDLADQHATDKALEQRIIELASEFVRVCQQLAEVREECEVLKHGLHDVDEKLKRLIERCRDRFAQLDKTGQSLLTQET